LFTELRQHPQTENQDAREITAHEVVTFTSKIASFVLGKIRTFPAATNGMTSKPQRYMAFVTVEPNEELAQNHPEGNSILRE
jgi:hypothetical protein